MALRRNYTKWFRKFRIIWPSCRQKFISATNQQSSRYIGFASSENPIIPFPAKKSQKADFWKLPLQQNTFKIDGFLRPVTIADIRLKLPVFFNINSGNSWCCWTLFSEEKRQCAKRYGQNSELFYNLMYEKSVNFDFYFNLPAERRL